MSSTTKSRSEQAHRSTVTSTIADVAMYLQEVLGQKLVAYLADVSGPKTVGRWASGAQHPRPDAEQRLRAAYQVFAFLQSGDSAHTARAWLIGLNPQLDDESPVTAIRDGRLRDVMTAAKSYSAGG